jgi:hypothetical protein
MSISALPVTSRRTANGVDNLESAIGVPIVQANGIMSLSLIFQRIGSVAPTDNLMTMFAICQFLTPFSGLLRQAVDITF